MAPVTVKLVCKINENHPHHIYKNEEGQLVLEFYQTVDNLNVNDSDELGDLQTDMLWECFDSNLIVE